MKLSIIRRWRLMRTLDDRGPHWIDAPVRASEHADDPDVRTYRRELAHVDEVLRAEAPLLAVPLPSHIERQVMNAVRSCSSTQQATQKQMSPRTRLALRASVAALAASILWGGLWAWSRFDSRATEDSQRRRHAVGRDATSPVAGSAELSGRGIRTQLCVLDHAVEEPLRCEVRYMQKDARAMAANTASWLPKPWLALLTGESAAPR